MKSMSGIMMALVVLRFSGCGSDASNNEMIIFNQKAVSEQYLAIIWDDREYVPYCAIGSSEGGDYLGYIEDDSDLEIYELDGHSSEEWIISYLNLGMFCSEAMLYKEISVQDIPDGFSSEYDWNND